MKKGKFIVFEGIDGCGKGTQSKMLFEYLTSKGIPCYKTCEPTDSRFGTLIRQCLKGEVETDEKTIAALFVADRFDHLYNKADGLIEKINSGVTVICDRYYFSSYAYHGAFMPIEWVIDANRLCADALKPDVTLFIDIEPERSFERLSRRNALERYEKIDSLEKIRKKYFEAFELLKNKERVEIVKSAEAKADTQAQIRKITDKLF